MKHKCYSSSWYQLRFSKLGSLKYILSQAECSFLAVWQGVCKTVYCAYVNSLLRCGIVLCGTATNAHKVLKSKKFIIWALSNRSSKTSCIKICCGLKFLTLTLTCIFILETLKQFIKNQINLHISRLYI